MNAPLILLLTIIIALAFLAGWLIARRHYQWRIVEQTALINLKSATLDRSLLQPGKPLVGVIRKLEQVEGQLGRVNAELGSSPVQVAFADCREFCRSLGIEFKEGFLE